MSKEVPRWTQEQANTSRTLPDGESLSSNRCTVESLRMPAGVFPSDLLSVMGSLDRNLDCAPPNPLKASEYPDNFLAAEFVKFSEPYF